MNSAEILKRAKEVVQIARVPAEEVPPVKNFLDYGALVVHAAKSLSARDRQAMPWIMDWATGFRRLYDNFAAEVEADPMLLYEPANPVALAFHKSPKYVRYFMAGNRSSKTQSGFAEDYWVLTGQHPYWDLGTGRTAVALVPGMTFTQYDETVLGPKWFSHEPGNPLSPIFPENGKWFYHLDERKHTLLVACPECAAAKKAQSCKHPKSRFTWFSEELGFEALQGAVYNLVHFDEDLADQKFFAEAKTRTLSCQGRIVLTGTPLHGDQAWEQKEVYFPWLSANRNHEVIEVFTVSMYEGGIISKEAVDQYKASLEDEFEIRARIYGEPLPISNSPVFDRTALREMRAAHAKPPERGWLRFKEATIRPEMVQPDSAIEFAADASAPYRIWEKPVPGAVYVVGVDEHDAALHARRHGLSHVGLQEGASESVSGAASASRRAGLPFAEAEHDDRRAQVGAGARLRPFEHEEPRRARIVVEAGIGRDDDEALEHVGGDGAAPHRLGRADRQLSALLAGMRDAQRAALAGLPVVELAARAPDRPAGAAGRRQHLAGARRPGAHVDLDDAVELVRLVGNPAPVGRDRRVGLVER